MKQLLKGVDEFITGATMGAVIGFLLGGLFLAAVCIFPGNGTNHAMGLFYVPFMLAIPCAFIGGIIKLGSSTKPKATEDDKSDATKGV
jgi:hypothetical protein